MLLNHPQNRLENDTDTISKIWRFQILKINKKELE